MNKRIPSIILSTIILASILLPLIYLATPAQAAGTVATIETSTPNNMFNHEKVVEVRIFDPDVTDWNATQPYITINGQVLNLSQYAYIFPDRTLRIYIGGPDANDTLPLPAGIGTVYQWGGGPSENVSVYRLGSDAMIVYRDYTVPEGAYQDVSITLYYANMTATLTTDRDETGIPPKAILHLTVVDSDANTNPFEADTFTLDVKVNISGRMESTRELTFTETGASSEEFIAELDLSELSGLNWADVYPGDFIRISFTDPETGEEVVKDIPVLITDATLSIDKSGFGYPEKAKIELIDADRNLDTQSIDTATVTVKITWSDGTTEENLTLVETGANTGVFTATIVPILDSTNKIEVLDGELDIYVKPGEKPSFKVEYKDEYYVTYQVSEAYTSFVIATPSVSFGKETYTPTDTVLTIILDNDNLNDYPTDYDKITIREDATILAKGTIEVGNITVTFYDASGAIKYFYGKDNITNILRTTTITESGKDTGEFKIYLDLTKEGISLADITGGKVEVKIYDEFIGDYITATASIGGVVGELTVDRTELPVNPGKWITVYFTITDSDQNRNPAAIDELSLDLITIEIYNATGHKVAIFDSSNLTGLRLVETDRNTGVFPGTFKVLLNETGLYFDFGGGSVKDVTTVLGRYAGYSMINGKIRIKYEEPLAPGGYVYVDLTFKAHDAKLEVSPTSVSYGDTLTITVTAPDYNLDTKAKDEVTVVVNGKPVTLIETCENSGVFTAEITVGDPAGDLPYTVFKVGNTYTIEFHDSATSAAYYSIMSFESTTLKSSFTILSHTAKIWVQADKVSPYGSVVVYVYDPDLLYSDSATLALVKVAGTRDEERSLTSTKAYGNGTFEFDLPLVVAASASPNDGKLQVNTVDTIYIYYTDDVNAEGSVEVLSLTVNVVSETGSIETDKELYKPGEWLIITIKDFDRNTNPTVIESVRVTLYSTSYPVGIDVTATETGPDTGVFTAKVLLKDIAIWTPGEPGTLPVKLGDTVTIEYVDKSNVEGKEEVVTKTIRIAAAPIFPLKPTKPGPVAFVNPLTGEVVEKPKAGEWLAVTIELSNSAAVPVGFDVIVIVYDETGVPVAVQVAHNVIEPGIAQIPVTIGKLPAGTYTVKILLWESLVSMKPLSEEVLEFTLTIEE